MGVGCEILARRSSQNSSTSQPCVALTVDEVNDPARIAAGKGFKLGSPCYKRSTGSNGGLFTLEAVSATTATVTPISLFDVSGGSQHVALEGFLKEWSPYKGDVQTLVAEGWHRSYALPCKDVFKIDVAKSGLFLAISAYQETVAPPWAELVQLAVKPQELYTTGKIDKGKLVLVPTVPLACIVTRASSSAIRTGTSVLTSSGRVDLFIQKPSQPASPSIEDWKPSDFVVPFSGP